MRCRRPTMSVLLGAFTLSAAVACSSQPLQAKSDGEGAGDESPPERGGSEARTTTGLPCDVDKVLKERCQSCHGSETQYGAPNALVTHDDLHAPRPSGKKTYEVVQERIHDDARPMPQAPNPRLSAEELATLDAWIAGGAKASEEACDNAKAETGVKPLSCTPDVTIKPSTRWAMPKDKLDVYACVGFDYEVAEKRHITALAPHVDNKKILHHILLMESPTAVDSTPFECGATVSATWKLIAGWAPGGENFELPPEAGFPAKKGKTHYVLQLHYNNAKGLEGETDASGYDFCTTDKLRPNDAGTLAFGSMNFRIPPRSTHKIRCDYRLPSQFRGVKLIQTWPHMHDFGVAMSTEHIAGGGEPKSVVDVKSFSFQDQISYPASTDVAPGDIIRTRCTWKNTSGETLQWGEGTGDEMCYNFTTYYPNIPDTTIAGLPLFTWVTPSLLASCSEE